MRTGPMDLIDGIKNLLLLLVEIGFTFRVLLIRLLGQKWMINNFLCFTYTY